MHLCRFSFKDEPALLVQAFSSGLLQEARAACAGTTTPAQAAIERGRLASRPGAPTGGCPANQSDHCSAILLHQIFVNSSPPNFAPHTNNPSTMFNQNRTFSLPSQITHKIGCIIREDIQRFTPVSCFSMRRSFNNGFRV